MRPEDVTAASREFYCDLCGDDHPAFVLGELQANPPGGDALCAVCEEHLREGDWERAIFWIRTRQGVDVGSRDEVLLATAARPKWDSLRELVARGHVPRAI